GAARRHARHLRTRYARPCRQGPHRRAAPTLPRATATASAAERARIPGPRRAVLARADLVGEAHPARRPLARPDPRRGVAPRGSPRGSTGTRVPASAATATPGTAAASLRSGPTRAPAPPSPTSSAATTPTTPGVRSSRAWTYSAGSRARPPRGSATATRRTSTSTSPPGSRDSTRRADPEQPAANERGAAASPTRSYPNPSPTRSCGERLASGGRALQRQRRLPTQVVEHGLKKD